MAVAYQRPMTSQSSSSAWDRLQTLLLTIEPNQTITLDDVVTDTGLSPEMVRMVLNGLAAAGLFVPLVLGIWWKRTTAAGAVAGMICGFSLCLYYLVGTRYFDMQLWFGIRNISSALFGLPVAFIVTIVVSLMTEAPSKEMQDFVDSIRVPKGDLAWVKGAQHD